MTTFRALAAFGLVAGLFVLIGDTAAQVRPGQSKVIKLPGQPVPGQPRPVIVGGELPVVPKSSAAFISVKVSALVDHPDFKPVLEQLKQTPEAFDGLTEIIGLAPHEIDRITLFWSTVGDMRWLGDPILVVTTREAFNEARVLNLLKAEPVFNGNRRRGGLDRHDHGPWGGANKSAVPAKGSSGSAKSPDSPPKFDPPPKLDLNPPKPPGDEDACTATAAADAIGEPLFYEMSRGPFGLLFLVDDRTLVFLPEDFGHGGTHLALLAQLMQKRPSGPLAEAIAAGSNHTLAAGIHLTPLFREFDRGMPPELAPYAALLAARTGVVTGDLGKSAKLTLTLSFDDAAAAKRAGPVLEEGLKTLAGKASELAAEMKAGNAWQEKSLAPIVETVATGLKNAAVKANGNAVVATTDVEVGPAAGKAAGELIQSLASQKKLTVRSNNLKQIGLALHNYHDAMGRLPTNVYNAKGEAILSWRVHLLPYFEEDNLFRQFKMDEPWDGPNNKKFIEQMPKVYGVSGREAPKGMTYLQGFVSPDPRKPLPKGAERPRGQAWLVEGEKQGRSLAAIPDGTSNTIAVVEAREAVIWSKPDDLPFGEKLPLLGPEKSDRFLALMFDGSIRQVPANTDPTILRALITVNGGEVIPNDFDGPRRPGGIIEPRPPIIKDGGPGKLSDDNHPKPIDQVDREELLQLRELVERVTASIDRDQARVELCRAETDRLAKLVEVGAAKREELEESRKRLAEATRRVVESKAELAVMKRTLDAKSAPPPREPKKK